MSVSSEKKGKKKKKNNRAEIKTTLFVNEQRFLLDGSRIQGNSEKLIYRKRFPNREHCAIGNNGRPTFHDILYISRWFVR